MTWLASIGVALLTAVLGTVLAGIVASFAVGWYQISGFEGGSGYFVVGLSLAGFVGGLVIGLVVSVIVALSADPSSGRMLSWSVAVLLGVVGVVGGTARVLADVPPTIGGETLLLAVEVRWPAAHLTSPAEEPGEGWLRLHSVPHLTKTARASRSGPLWMREARLVEGQWVASGAVEVFTERGKRLLEVVVDDSSRAGFRVPLSSRPGRAALQWSEWLPRPRRGAPPLADGFSYRYRVQPRSQPVRTEEFGPFEVATLAHGFSELRENGRVRIETIAQFTIRHHGQPLMIEGPTSEDEERIGRFERVTAVAAVQGPRPALLVLGFDQRGGYGGSYLLVSEGDGVRVELVRSHSYHEILAYEFTADAARFHDARAWTRPRGHFDRETFDREGLFAFGSDLLDTRRLTTHRLEQAGDLARISEPIPLTLSPDERSIVRFAYAEGSTDAPVLLVTDLAADSTYVLPIDHERKPFHWGDRIDPEWIAHYFAWEPGRDGVSRLVEREGVSPLPLRRSRLAANDGHLTYRLWPAGYGLLMALADFLVAEYGAEVLRLQPDNPPETLRIDDTVVSLAFDIQHSAVVLWADRAASPELVPSIARRFDAALATGTYDALFRD